MQRVFDERQRRLFAAAEAKMLDHGGVTRVTKATGVARGSILAGIKELNAARPVGIDSTRRVRRAGGGRKKLVDIDPSLVGDLERLVEPVARGDP